MFLLSSLSCPPHCNHALVHNRNYTPFLLVFEQKYYKVFIKIVTFSHFFLVVLLFISDIPYIPLYVYAEGVVWENLYALYVVQAV